MVERRVHRSKVGVGPVCKESKRASPLPHTGFVWATHSDALLALHSAQCTPYCNALLFRTYSTYCVRLHLRDKRTLPFVHCVCQERLSYGGGGTKRNAS